MDEEDCKQIALAGAGAPGFGSSKGGNAKLGPNEEGSLAGTTVFVLDPSKAPCK